MLFEGFDEAGRGTARARRRGGNRKSSLAGRSRDIYGRLRPKASPGRPVTFDHEAMEEGVRRAVAFMSGKVGRAFDKSDLVAIGWEGVLGRLRQLTSSPASLFEPEWLLARRWAKSKIGLECWQKPNTAGRKGDFATVNFSAYQREDGRPVEIKDVPRHSSVEAREQLERLVEASSLSDSQRAALALYIQGYGVREIGRMLGINATAARNRIHRATAAMKAAAEALAET